MMTEPGQSDSLQRSVELARKIWRRVAPANAGPAEAVGITRSERSDAFDTAELVLRIDDHRFLVEVRELTDVDA